MPRAFTIALLAAVLAGLALAPGALATGDLTIGPGGTPAPGKIVSTGSGPLAFSIPAGCAGLNAYVEVASDVQYDPDGTLYGPLTVERFGVIDTGNGLYEGTASGDWLQTPGTYYWQLDGMGACDAAGADLWVGPVTSPRRRPTCPIRRCRSRCRRPRPRCRSRSRRPGTASRGS
jgi:hypothetical protein